jgi:hypothetical protein
MIYNSSNPLIPHASQSMQRDEFKMQSFINSLARKMIKKDAKSSPKKKEYYIHGEELISLPIPQK